MVRTIPIVSDTSYDETDMKTISTTEAPTPAGHYSQAVVHGGLAYVAGQLAIDPSAPDAPRGGAGAQTRQALANVDAILRAAGSGLPHTLQMTVYITDGSLWPEVNAAYAEVMGDHRPARAIVPVGPLKSDFVIEIQAIAAIPEDA